LRQIALEDGSIEACEAEGRCVENVRGGMSQVQRLDNEPFEALAEALAGCAQDDLIQQTETVAVVAESGSGITFRGMGQEVPDPHDPRALQDNAEVGHRSVQVQLSRLHQLHDDGRGEDLGEGGQVVRGRVGRGRPELDIRVPEAPGPDHPLAVGDSRRHPGDLKLAPQRLQLCLKLRKVARGIWAGQ
jgi:hypothetical protein